MVCLPHWLQLNWILQAPVGCLAPSPATSICCLSLPSAHWVPDTDLPLGSLHVQTPNQMGELQPTELDPTGEDRAVAGGSDFLEA